MQFRIATEEDVPFILSAARDIHSEFTDKGFDEDKTLDTIYSFLGTDLSEKMLVVAYTEKKYTGVIAGMLSTTPFSNEKVALEPLFWTDKNPKTFLLLHKVFNEWCKKLSVDYCLVSTPTLVNLNKLEKLYSKLGYSKFEYTFIKRMK